MSVLIETSLGDLVIDLFHKEAPLACTNFLKLCKVKFYHSCLIHTVHRDFIALSGDPTNNGNGGNSIWGLLSGQENHYFKTETHESLSHDRPGLLSTANDAANKNTSAFFITLAGGLNRLDKKHTIFGEIVEGLDVLMALNIAYCDSNNQPIQVIRIKHTDILHDPFPDPTGLIIPDHSPEPPELPSGRIDDNIKNNEFEGMTEEEIAEYEKEKEKDANTEVLVMLGDIKNKDVAPPENVLFICKLNPLTEEEDLELLFSQFGSVIGCEIIKDHITGDSLCFGFIEFDNRKNCERAYLKMDNVLIDDRRIHVDFSQSTSKHTASAEPGASRYGHLMGKNNARQEGRPRVEQVSRGGRDSGRNRDSERSRDYDRSRRSDRRDERFSERNRDSRKSRDYDSNRESDRSRNDRYSSSSGRKERDYGYNKRRRDRDDYRHEESDRKHYRRS